MSNTKQVKVYAEDIECKNFQYHQVAYHIPTGLTVSFIHGIDIKEAIVKLENRIKKILK